MQEELPKEKIIRLYERGLSTRRINRMTGYSMSLINVYVSKHNRNSVKAKDLFNVNELDCWVFPSSKVN